MKFVNKPSTGHLNIKQNCRWVFKVIKILILEEIIIIFQFYLQKSRKTIQMERSYYVLGKKLSSSEKCKDQRIIY